MEVVTAGLAVGIWVFLLTIGSYGQFCGRFMSKPLAAAQTVLNFWLAHEHATNSLCGYVLTGFAAV